MSSSARHRGWSTVSKFVRAIVIEGLPGELDAMVQSRLEDWAKSNRCTIVLASTVEESYFDEFLNQ